MSILKPGNYHDSLSDAKAATELQPTFLKAIVRGEYRCVVHVFKKTVSTQHVCIEEYL